MATFNPPKSARPSGQRTPGGTALTSGGGGFDLSSNSTVNLPYNVVRDIQKGQGKFKNLKNKDRGLYDSIVNNRGLGINAQDLFNKRPGLFELGKVKEEVKVNPQSEQGSRDTYDTLRDLELERLKNQTSVNNMLMGFMPSLLNANRGAVNKYQSMIDDGFTEIDPAINERINKGVQGYIGNATNNLKDLYTGIADGFVNDVAQGGVGGFGVGEGFKNQVTEPLARELGNVVNNAEVYRGQLTNDVLSNARAGASTIASTAPALNQVLQGFQLPTTQVNPAAINPTGNFDPNLLANMLQFANTFQAGRDDKRLEPWMLQFQADLQKEIAAAQQNNGFGDFAATLGAVGLGSIMGPAGSAVGTHLGNSLVNKLKK